MLATIFVITWNMLNTQHINRHLKRLDYSDIPNGGHKKIEGPAHMVECDHHLRTAPNSHPPWKYMVALENYKVVLKMKYWCCTTLKCSMENPNINWTKHSKDIANKVFDLEKHILSFMEKIAKIKIPTQCQQNAIK